MKEYIMEVEMGNAPITVQPLVRCKDCKHAKIYENCVKCENAGNPGIFATYHRIDWFCADGEPKDSD